MNDYIRKAVGLADGWSHWDYGRRVICKAWEPHFPHGLPLDGLSQVWLDALAAQLVRQVDALPAMTFEVYQTFSRLTLIDSLAFPVTEFYGRDNDRTMNTIRAIVDSKVLE